MKKKTTADSDVIVMDEGWNAEIRRAVAQAKKSAAKTKSDVPRVTDPKKRQAAIEAAIKNVNFEKKKK